MKFFVLNLICVTGFFFVSCSDKCPAGDAGYALIRTYAKETEKKEYWSCDGLGGGFDYDRIRTLGTGFDVDDPNVTVEKARKMFIKGAEGFLTAINNDPKVRPYLVHYPFTHHDVEFSLSFPRRTAAFVSNVNVGYATLVNGKIYYCSYDKELDKLTDLCNEDYSEALKIVRETNTFATGGE